MAFQKGNKLAVGNAGPVRFNMITQVIVSQLNEVDKNTSKEKIHLLVDQLIKQALGYTKTIKGKDGKNIKVEVPSDLGAIREIIDRVQGRAPVTISGDPDNPLELVHRVERAVTAEIIDIGRQDTPHPNRPRLSSSA